MCFSAGASFGAGTVLTVIGIASLKKAKKKSEVAFAVIPLIFALQQATEGFLWLALSDPAFELLRRPATHLFLFLAQVVWPFWVPFSILLLEKKHWRRNAEIVLTMIGTIVSLYLAYCLFSYPVGAKIIERHISYQQEYPIALSRYGGLFYVVGTIGPPFLSAIKGMRMLGVAIFVSYFMTNLFYNNYIVSVWCFFASIISVAVYVILSKMKKNGEAAVSPTIAT